MRKNLKSELEKSPAGLSTKKLYAVKKIMLVEPPPRNSELARKILDGTFKKMKQKKMSKEI